MYLRVGTFRFAPSLSYQPYIYRDYTSNVSGPIADPNARGKDLQRRITYGHRAVRHESFAKMLRHWPAPRSS